MRIHTFQTSEILTTIWFMNFSPTVLTFLFPGCQVEHQH